MQCCIFRSNITLINITLDCVIQWNLTKIICAIDVCLHVNTKLCLSTRTNFFLGNIRKWQRELFSISIKLSHHQFLFRKGKILYIKIMFFSCYNAQNEKHEHTCSMVAMSCNFLMKLILWVNFDVTGNQYEQEKVFYHIQMMECSRICKKIWSVTEIYFNEIVDNESLS